MNLAVGAVLVTSHERNDYNADDFCPQNRVFAEEYVTGAHLICAIEQENIVIEGHGTNYVGIGLLGRWSERTKSVSSMENICISNANIHSRYPIEMCVAYGETPLPHECYIRNITMNNLMLVTEKSNILKGFPGAPLENILMNNVIILPGKNSDEKLLQMSMVSDISFDNVKIIGRDEITDGISTEHCTNVKL